MAEVEYLDADVVGKLTDKEKIFACQAIRAFGTNDHPFAEIETLPFFAKDYTIVCVAKASVSDLTTDEGKEVAKAVIKKLTRMEE